MKCITTIASLSVSPSLSKNSRDVQDARERFGDSGQAAVAGGQASRRPWGCVQEHWCLLSLLCL